jgi:NADH-quinone oxidoreductase subunit M
VTNPENENLKDLNKRELLYLLPLVVLCFWIGLYPKPFFAVLEKPVDYIVRKVDAEYASSVAGTPAAAVEVEGAE